MKKAFKQVEDADFVLDFYTWEDWRIKKPQITSSKSEHLLNQKNLKFLINSLKIERNLAVIILDKRDSGISISEIKHFLKNIGFKNIIFQAGVSDMHPEGRPILSE